MGGGGRRGRGDAAKGHALRNAAVSAQDDGSASGDAHLVATLFLSRRLNEIARQLKLVGKYTTLVSGPQVDFGSVGLCIREVVVTTDLASGEIGTMSY